MIHGWGGSASQPWVSSVHTGTQTLQDIAPGSLGLFGWGGKARTQKGDRGAFPAPEAHSESRLAWVLAEATVMKQPQ